MRAVARLGPRPARRYGDRAAGRGTAVGQFDPAAAGGQGRRRSARGVAGQPVGLRPAVEGALLFAASAVRRNQHAAGRAAMPFTVSPSPDGSASGAAGEESRGEVWAPVWTQEFTLAEVRQLFAEARASWHGRPARRPVDFYAATRTLGVAGNQRVHPLRPAAPQRAGVLGSPSRQGRSSANGPKSGWRPTSRTGPPGSPAMTPRGGRRGRAALRDRAPDYARDGGALPWPRMLAALTELELAVGHSGRSRRYAFACYARLPPGVLAVLQAERARNCGSRPASRPALPGGPGRSRRAVAQHAADPAPGRPAVPGDRSQPNGRWRSDPRSSRASGPGRCRSCSLT